ncbi:MAG: alkaline phosphatase D family protein, partial [Lentimonas sp.]
QLENPGYKTFNESHPIISTWDDHDYDWNDANKDYPIKHLTENMALDFTGVPANDPRRQRGGIYGAYDFGPYGQSVKVILLDGRYFATGKKAQKPTLIGSEQKAWLAKELQDSTAQIHLIVSGIQVISEEHNYESWAKYPQDREWLLSLIDETNTSGVVFISGDRHIHELSVLRDARFDYPLLDATSSGLTQSWENFKGEPNQHRIGEVHKELGFGLIKLNWSESNCAVSVDLRDINNQAVNNFSLDVPLK